jgi:hypothetical protein
MLCVWWRWYYMWYVFDVITMSPKIHFVYEIPCAQWVPLRPHITRTLELDETIRWVFEAPCNKDPWIGWNRTGASPKLHCYYTIPYSLVSKWLLYPPIMFKLVLLIGTPYYCILNFLRQQKTIDIWSRTIILGEKTPGVGQSFQDRGSTVVYIVLWTNRCIHSDVQNLSLLVPCVCSSLHLWVDTINKWIEWRCIGENGWCHLSILMASPTHTRWTCWMGACTWPWFPPFTLDLEFIASTCNFYKFNSHIWWAFFKVRTSDNMSKPYALSCSSKSKVPALKVRYQSFNTY